MYFLLIRSSLTLHFYKYFHSLTSLLLVALTYLYRNCSSGDDKGVLLTEPSLMSKLNR